MFFFYFYFKSGLVSYPTMLLSSEAEGNLVGLLNESIKEKNLSTRIVIYDHNWDNINYARDILSSDVGSDVYGMS